MNLIINGDFEKNTPDTCDITMNCTLNDHSRAILPWIISRDNVTFDYIGTKYSEAHSGNYSLDLSSNTPFTISQYVAVTQNQRYKLEFYVKGLFEMNQSGIFWIDSYPLQTFTSSYLQWASVEYTFTALSNVSVVNIGTLLPNSGLLLDDATLTEALPTASPSPQQPDALSQGLVFGGIIFVILLFVGIGIAILSKKPRGKTAIVDSVQGSTTVIDCTEVMEPSPKQIRSYTAVEFNSISSIKKSDSIPVDINRIQLMAVNPVAYSSSNQPVQLIHNENIEHYSRCKIEQSQLEDKIKNLK
ncbi:hypothetical protein HDV01_007152 [Terramyces sp. JEL0728]|nr:hypothetical protein HDV01_007152 [Terramyces sp. JEL0728]